MSDNLYEICKALAKDNTVSISKAATDYEIGGVLTPSDGITLFDAIVKQTDIVSKIRMVNAYSNSVNLNSILNKGVLVGRAGAGAAKEAIIAGNDVAGIEKANIGNKVTLEEFYFLLSLLYAEMTNMARIYRNAKDFNNAVASQFGTDYQETLERLLFVGDGGENQPHGLIPLAKANLGDGSTGKTVRNVDTAAMTTITEKLKALRAIQSTKWRKSVVYFMSVADYDTYKDEVDASSSYSTSRGITEDREYNFDGRPIVASPHIEDDNILVSPYDNMCLVRNIVDMGKSAEAQKVPVALLYSVVSFWDYAFVTYDKVAIAYDQT